MILYSNNCPKCMVLKEKLYAKKISFEECNDVSIMLEKGIIQVPYLEVNGKLMDFVKANKYINNL